MSDKLYRWVRASELPKESDLYPCLCEKNVHGVKTQTVTFGEYRTVYNEIKVDEEKYGEVVEWLSEIEADQDEMWNNLMDEWHEATLSNAYVNIVDYLKSKIQLIPKQ